MNQFDTLYFAKYVGGEDDLLFVCHRHPILIIDDILLWTFFGGVIPTFFYLQNTFSFADILPGIYFHLFLILIYLCIAYRIFDWYNDVWIITHRGIIDIQWKFFTGNVHYIEYENIHGIEVKTNSFVDSIFGKGDIIIHLEGESDDFALDDAKEPKGIVDYIQAIIEEIEEGKNHHSQTEIDDRQPFELLLDTLTEMVKEHLEKKGANTDEDTAEKKQKIKEVMRYASTIDLREGVVKSSKEGKEEGH